MQYITAVFAVILLLLAIIFLPSLFVSLHAIQVSTATESGNVTTGGGETTGNLTLSEELYNSAIVSVLSLSSTNENDVPYAVVYNEGTLTLTAGGLEASATRILTTEYEYINPDNNSNMGAVATFLGVLVAFAIIVLLVVIPGGTIASVWSRFR